MEKKFILGTVLCVAIIGITIFYFFGMRYLAPIETVKGGVLDVLLEWDNGGPNEPDRYYTWVIVSDPQSVIWIFEHDGHVPFVIGETYTFEVRMWPCGSYSGPQVTQWTAVYPLADYSPRITPAPGSPLFPIAFILIAATIFFGPMLLRYRRNRGSWPWSRLWPQY